MLRDDGFDKSATHPDLAREALQVFNKSIFDCEDFLTGDALYKCLGIVPDTPRR